MTYMMHIATCVVTLVTLNKQSDNVATTGVNTMKLITLNKRDE